MTTYQEYKECKKNILLSVDRAEQQLKKVSKTNYGQLVTDKVLNSQEYRKALLTFKVSFNNLQSFNKQAPKEYSRQYSRDKRNGLI